MSLFEQEQNDQSETDKIMNRLSKESIIKSSENPNRTSRMLRELDIDGFQQYIMMIDRNK